MPGGPAYPSPFDVYVPSPEASGGLIVGFSRNANDFPVNRYIQIYASKQMFGMFWSYTSRNAARIISPTDAEHTWADGDAAPPGLNNLESFQLLPYKCARKAYPFTLGELTVEQMSFDLLVTQSRDMAQQAMTARTMLVHAALAAASWGTNTKPVDGTGTAGPPTGSILPAGQNWLTGSVGFDSNPGPNIKKSIQYGQRQINLATIGVVRPRDMTLVINPTTAQAMAASTEIQDYLKQSPVALAQLKGDAPSQNGMWGLPDTLYGVDIQVEDAVRVSSRKGAATDALGYVMPDGVAYLIARQGKLQGIAGSRSFSTIQVFFYKDEMTVETLYDINNKRYMGRVISNYVPIIATPYSGFRFTRVLG
jgi:hypothetical protein